MRSRTQREREGMHYWIVAKEPDTNKTILIYGDNNESGARDKGFEMLPGIDFIIKPLRTRDLSRASSLLKGNRLEKTRSLKKATEHLVHEKGVAFNRKRRHNQNKEHGW